MNERFDHRKLHHLLGLFATTFIFLIIPLTVYSAISRTAVISEVKASGATYYVDCGATNGDGSAGSPWSNLTSASGASLNSGDSLLLKRGCTWSGPLNLATNKNGITVDAYGSGAMPTIQNTNPANVVVTGSNITIKNIYAFNNTYDSLDTACRTLSDAAWSSGTNQRVGWRVGFDFKAGATYNTLQDSKSEGMTAGVYLEDSSHHNKILNNQILDNTLQSVLTVGGNDDGGTFGILLHGDDNEIANNTISGQDACSYDTGASDGYHDGGGIEVFGGQRNNIHHNRADNNAAFTELGNSRSAANIFAYNLVTSSLKYTLFLNTRGSSDSFGPVSTTKAYNNTVYLTGAHSQGAICYSVCNSSILSLKNNILWVNWKTAYADGPFDESNNIYWKTGGSPLIQDTAKWTIAATSGKVDPQFVGVGSDFLLKSSSPAVNSGVNLSYSSDFDGNPVPKGGVPDIGAFEYQTPSSSDSQLTIGSGSSGGNTSGGSSAGNKTSSGQNTTGQGSTVYQQTGSVASNSATRSASSSASKSAVKKPREASSYQKAAIVFSLMLLLCAVGMLIFFYWGWRKKRKLTQEA